MALAVLISPSHSIADEDADGDDMDPRHWGDALRGRAFLHGDPVGQEAMESFQVVLGRLSDVHKTEVAVLRDENQHLRTERLKLHREVETLRCALQSSVNQVLDKKSVDRASVNAHKEPGCTGGSAWGGDGHYGVSPCYAKPPKGPSLGNALRTASPGGDMFGDLAVSCSMDRQRIDDGCGPGFEDQHAQDGDEDLDAEMALDTTGAPVAMLRFEVNQEEDDVQYSEWAIEAWTRVVARVVTRGDRAILLLKSVWKMKDFMHNEMARRDSTVDLVKYMHSHNRRATLTLDGILLASARGWLSQFVLEQVCPRCLFPCLPSSYRTDVHEGEHVKAGDADEDDEHEVSRCALNPQSPRRISWALTGIMLMVHDIFMLPFYSAFNIEMFPESGLYNFYENMNIISQVYWTADIGVSFFTGVYIDSNLEMRLSKIAYHYLTGFFAVDCIITLPLWAIIMFDKEATATSSTARFARYLRMLRFLRLARVMKMEQLLNETLAFINSSVILLVIKILKLMVYLALITHVNACCWFAVGELEWHTVTGSLQGWARNPKFEEASMVYQYFSSLHWALTQFQGTSDVLPGDTLVERVYACVAVLVALLVFSSFVSSLTNMMMLLQRLHDERSTQQMKMCGFLSSQRVSIRLSVRVRKYVEWRQLMHEKVNDNEEILDILPLQMRSDVLEEVRTPVLVDHPLFAAVHDKYPRLFRRLCGENTTVMFRAPGELIFGPGDECFQMYFLVDGVVSYLRLADADAERKKGRRTKAAGAKPPDAGYQAPSSWCRTPHAETAQHAQHVSLCPGQHLCEAVLWVPWKHSGRLDIITDASLVTMEAKKFESIVPVYPTAHTAMVLYARKFAAAMNCMNIVSDYIPGLTEIVLGTNEQAEDSDDED